MTSSYRRGYAFTISLPPADDERLRAWAEATPSATWDSTGGHVTVVRLAGEQSIQVLTNVLREACAGVEPFEAAFSQPVRRPYWGKPGMEIVMLAGETEASVAGVLALRGRILAALRPAGQGLELMEGGLFVPHVTLTTGLPDEEAQRLEAAASSLSVRFIAREIVLWSSGDVDGSGEAAPQWDLVDRMFLARL